MRAAPTKPPSQVGPPDTSSPRPFSATSLVSEEIFGPIAPIVSYCSDTELLDYTNRSEYRLAA